MTPDTSDAADRLRGMNADLSDWDRIREEGERISREEGYRVMQAEIALLHAEIDRLWMTAREREAVQAAIDSFAGGADFNAERGWPATAQRLRQRAADLRELLARMSGGGEK